MSVPPRQSRPTSNTSTRPGRNRNATVLDPPAVNTTSSTSSGSSSRSNNPFTARRRESRPDLRQRLHGVSNTNNNSSNYNTPPGRTPAAPLRPPAPRPSYPTSRLLGSMRSPPSAPRPEHAVARPTSTIPDLSTMDDLFTRRTVATPRHLRRGGAEGAGRRTQENVGFDSPEFNASPIAPWDMLFTPNTQVIETTAVVGTPVTTRLADAFSSIVVTPEQEDSQEGSSSAVAGISTASFIKRPSRIAFEVSEDEEEDEGEEEDNLDDSSEVHAGDKALDDDDVESFLSKRESLIRGRRAIEKQPRRLSSHTGPHDLYYSSSSVGIATPEGFTTPRFRALPPLSAQLPTRTPGVGPSRFNPSLMSRDDPDTPVGRNKRDQTSNEEPPSLWTNAARRAILDLKKHVYQDEGNESQSARGDMSPSNDFVTEPQVETPVGMDRILPPSLIRRSEPERDPFLQTPRPTGDSDLFGLEPGHDEEVGDVRDFDGDIALDEADLEEDFQSAADTAFISEDRDSIAELLYEPEDLEEERRRRSEAMEPIRANRSFELGMKDAAEEATRATTAAAQELLDASAEVVEAKVEAIETDEKILKRQLDAELGRVMSIFEDDTFEEDIERARRLPPTSILLSELAQERNGQHLTTPEELEYRSWMYEVGRVGRPQRVGVWARV